jgi:hypothetical protein
LGIKKKNLSFWVFFEEKESKNQRTGSFHEITGKANRQSLIQGYLTGSYIRNQFSDSCRLWLYILLKINPPENRRLSFAISNSYPTLVFWESWDSFLKPS